MYLLRPSILIGVNIFLSPIRTRGRVLLIVLWVLFHFRHQVIDVGDLRRLVLMSFALLYQLSFSHRVVPFGLFDYIFSLLPRYLLFARKILGHKVLII